LKPIGPQAFAFVLQHGGINTPFGYLQSITSLNSCRLLLTM